MPVGYDVEFAVIVYSVCARVRVCVRSIAFHVNLLVQEKVASTFVLKTITLGYFGLMVFHNLATFIMQKLKSLEWFYSVRLSTSALWVPFSSFRDEHGKVEARQLPRIQETDSLVPLNTIADARKMDGKTTMPCVPQNLGPARTIKKSVSISENVEEIIPNKMRKRKIYGMDNDDVKPLKSILKVGSRPREKQ
ncbi:hypothetical protein POM88_030081 [Heracleum sosnowskyi]|uniref:Uncharacterized protein n=1 Tax=Heracleum sosnowskyi TaxID=360622 RepID=A0AAD8HX25_9APIA|nr:hypothetical protein POM88_030081 [Heracleum sosnowskyi]